MCPQESSNVSLSVNPRRVIPPLQPRPLHSQPLIRLPLMFQASHFEPRRFAQRDEAAHSRERSFQRRSSMRHVTIILNNLPTEEYKVDSYVNAYPLFSRPIPPLPLLPFAIRPPSFSSVPRVFDRLYLSLSLSLFLFSLLLLLFSSFVFLLVLLLFFAALFLPGFRSCPLWLRYTSCLRFMFTFIIALLRALSFSLFSFFVLVFCWGVFFSWFVFLADSFASPRVIFMFKFNLFIFFAFSLSLFVILHMYQYRKYESDKYSQSKYYCNLIIYSINMLTFHAYTSESNWKIIIFFWMICNNSVNKLKQDLFV